MAGSDALLIFADRRETLGRGNQRAHRGNDLRSALERDQAEAVVADEVDVTAFLSRNVIVDDDRKLRGVGLGERSGARLGNEQIDGAKIFGNLIGEAKHLHWGRQRRRKLAEFLFEVLV